MIERDMEDLIATYPEDFFPRKKFRLIGRQQSFEEVGRFDLLFEDDHGSKVLMELKARTLKYEDATQVASYRDELRRRGHRNVWMWLVAPHIPSSVREFLDDKGIEYSEIHIAEFRRIAELRGFTIKSEAAKPVTDHEPVPSQQPRPSRRVGVARVSPVALVETGPVVMQPSALWWKAVGCDLMLVNPATFDSKKFSILVDDFEGAAKNKAASLIADLRAWAGDPARNRWPHESNRSLLRWTITPGSTYKRAVPSAEAIWTYMFGKPAPTWYWWERKDGYRFDPTAWKVWFESLSVVPAKLEATYFEHNSESARSWPAEKQCQCKDCQRYLSGQRVRAQAQGSL